MTVVTGIVVVARSRLTSTVRETVPGRSTGTWTFDSRNSNGCSSGASWRWARERGLWRAFADAADPVFRPPELMRAPPVARSMAKGAATESGEYPAGDSNGQWSLHDPFRPPGTHLVVVRTPRRETHICTRFPYPGFMEPAVVPAVSAEHRAGSSVVAVVGVALLGAVAAAVTVIGGWHSSVMQDPELTAALKGLTVASYVAVGAYTWWR